MSVLSKNYHFFIFSCRLNAFLNFIADKLPVLSIRKLASKTVDGIAPSRSEYKEILAYSTTVGPNDPNRFKQWLSQNPVTIQYELITPIIKTVPLTIQDKNGNTVTH